VLQSGDTGSVTILIKALCHIGPLGCCIMLA